MIEGHQRVRALMHWLNFPSHEDKLVQEATAIALVEAWSRGFCIVGVLKVKGY